MDADMPVSVIGTLRAIAAAADRLAASSEAGTTGPDTLDLRVVEILALEPFDEQAAAEKLVRDALHD
ncbi:MAG TPA: hypothetical protein VFQ44_10230 [Streptosporangiaceae bacterium]|nr:hypothetical protein [Streptosporangiaceae bacterium]